MDIKKTYAKAVKAYEAKKYVAALKILKDLQKHAPTYKKGYYLEALIWKERDNPVKQYRALQKILPLLDLSSPKEKAFNAEIFGHMARACDLNGFSEQACKYYVWAANYIDDENFNCYAIGNAIFLANCSEYFTAADFRALYDEYKKHLSDIVPFPKKVYDHKQIRVGYLSSDFKRHPVAMCSWSLFTKLNKKIFKVYCYSNVQKPDKVTELLSKFVKDGWRDITKLNDEEAAKLIRDDEIDILVDLNGHTGANRLRVAAYHPASIQVSGIGSVNSTGMDAFDYFFSDIYCTEDVATVSDYFPEKVIRMPYTHFCFNPSSNLEPAPEPPCIKNGYVTFGSFNNYRKVTDSILRTWKKILDAVPDSRLILKSRIYNTVDGKELVGKRLQKFGFDLKRVEMRGFSGDYLNQYNDVDIALDTFPYTGGVTTCEALYMGVPVISLYGGRHGERFGLSNLTNVGLGELAVDSYDEYVNRAVAVASDWELLTILRKNLRTMMKKSPLMNVNLYAREIAKLFIIILGAEQKSLEQNEQDLLEKSSDEESLNAPEIEPVAAYDCPPNCNA